MATDVITLRTAGSGDLDAIDTLLSESYTRLLKADYPPSVQVTAIPIIARVNPVLVMSGSYYVAEARNGELLGAGGWTRSVQGRGIGDVRHVVTHHGHLRRGIARRLMMGIFSEARLAGLKRLNCLSTRTALPFYRAMGFEGDREVTLALRPGIEFPVVRLTRTL